MSQIEKSDLSAFVPSKLEFAAIMVFAATLLALINIKQIFIFVQGDGDIDLEQEFVGRIQDFTLDKLVIVTADAATFSFWLIVGIAGLMLIDILRWLYSIYRSELPASNPLYPDLSGFDLKEIAIHFMVRSVALMSLIGWAAGFFVGALPSCNGLFLEGVSFSTDVYKLVLSPFLLSVYIFFAVILVRLLLLRKHPLT